VRILITGISGFVGRWLAKLLAEEGHRLTGAYLGAQPDLPGCQLREVDLMDAAGTVALVEASQPEAVIHLGGLSHVGSSWTAMGRYFQINVLGTENLLNAAGGCRFLFASSAEVYGPVPEAEQPIAEGQPVAPASPYALTKAAAERLVLAQGGVVVRSFNAVGPGQAPTFALPAFAAQLAAIARGRQEPVLRVGNLKARRDFVHVGDVAEAYRLLALRGSAPAVYNLATGKATSIAEALEILIRASGQKVRVETDPQRLRPIDVPLLCGDASRLRSLGWSPRKSLEEALMELWSASLGEED
jgi:GDP-4-dehydro-6-deoxy-D-mannose reductase